MKILKKIIFFAVIIYTTSLYSQWDQPIDTGYFQGIEIEYYKHYLEAQLDIMKINNLEYLQNVSDFLFEKGILIKRIWLTKTPIGGIDMILPNSLDALDAVSILKDSGLLFFIHPLGPYRIQK